MKLYVKISGSWADGNVINTVIPVNLLPSSGLEDNDVPVWDTPMSNAVDSFN